MSSRARGLFISGAVLAGFWAVWRVWRGKGLRLWLSSPNAEKVRNLDESTTEASKTSESKASDAPSWGRGVDGIGDMAACDPGAWPPSLAPLQASDVRDRLTVATWNTLRNHYHFAAHGSWVSARVQLWAHRRRLALATLDRLNADVLCLQECELRDLKEDFGSPLSARGYAYVTADPRGGHDHTKPVIFYRESKLDLIWHKKRSRAVVAQFKIKSGPAAGAFVFIASVHFQGGSQAPTRFSQARSVLQTLDRRIQAQAAGASGPSRKARKGRGRSPSKSVSPRRGRRGGSHSVSPRMRKPRARASGPQDAKEGSIQPTRKGPTNQNHFIFVCGDFNAFRGEPAYGLLRQGAFTAQQWDEDADGKPPRRVSYESQGVGGLSDAYEPLDRAEGGRPFTYQWGHASTDPTLVRHTIDYMLHSPNCSVMAVRRPLSKSMLEDVTRCGVPNDWHPSDHFPLAATFELRASVKCASK